MLASRLQRLDAMARELSVLEDPDHVIRAFSQEAALIVPRDGLVSVSRRGLALPAYRITRSWRWTEVINPWKEPERLPVFSQGILGDLLYRGEPLVINNLSIDDNDPAREHLSIMGALACAPSYDQGEAMNMVFLLRHEPESFRDEDLEHLVLYANLLGRAVNNLLLTQELEEAYQALHYEKSQVGRMQKHLLPQKLPRIAGLELGDTYYASSQAGGDYYDILPLPDDQWGIFVADVSGHGTPAAVVAAMVHTLLHAFPGPPLPPMRVLTHVNRHLLSLAPEGMFTTAFYGIYDPYYRRFRYANAGHPSPLLRHGDGAVEEVASGPGLPLGIVAEESWSEQEILLAPGDALLIYTDGIVDGVNPAGEVFGRERLERALAAGPRGARLLVQHLERQYKEFCQDGPETDDYTLVTAVAVP